ncbi:MAG: hypothetical protein ACHQJ4_01020 [Ignavibacteria bacterium]
MINEICEPVNCLPAVRSQAGELVNCNNNSPIQLPAEAQAKVGKSPVHKLRGKPKSAGNAGFRKHNRMKFMKTEKWKMLNKK